MNNLNIRDREFSTYQSPSIIWHTLPDPRHTQHSHRIQHRKQGKPTSSLLAFHLCIFPSHLPSNKTWFLHCFCHIFYALCHSLYLS